MRRRWRLRTEGALLALALLAATGTVIPRLAEAGTTTPLGAPASDVTADDSAAVEVGAQFTVGSSTSATGIRFYKGTGNSGTHAGRLWSPSGQVLASALFDGETATGWQAASFATPVTLSADTTYTVSYFAPDGHYSATEDAFADGNVLTSGSVRLTRGVYAYGASSSVPRSSWHDANYYVDVTTPGTTVPPSPPSSTPPPTPPDDSDTWPNSPPDAGTPDGTTLASMAGTTITQDGTVLSDKLILGTLTVAARNVVIRNSRVAGSGTFGVNVTNGGSLRILRTTVSGFDNGVGGDDYVADFVEVTGLRSDGFKLGSRVTVVNSWCHDLDPAPGAHADCGQLQAGETDLVVRHNWFDVGDGNAALFIAPDLGPSSAGPVTIVDNVLGGGSYTLYCVDGGDGRYFISDITVTGNHFLRPSRYGPVRVNVVVVWLTNTWLDSGLPIVL